MSSQPVTLSTENGATHLSLGALNSASPVGITRKVLIRNNSDQRLCLHLAFSENAQRYISLAHRYDDHNNIHPSPFEKSSNINLVCTVHDRLHQISLNAHTSSIIPLYIIASPTALCTTHVQRFTARLNLLDRSARTLTSISVHGEICESRLEVDHVRLDYGYCERLQWAYRQVQVRNLSGIATRFCISTGLPCGTQHNAYLKFFDVQAGEGQLDASDIPLAANGICVLRVAFRHTGAAKEEKWFAIENLENPNDVWHVRVFANAKLSSSVAETIDVDCGAQLDFGECFAFCPVFRDVTLFSKCEETVRVALQSNRRQQVRFEVWHEWGYENGERGDAEGLFPIVSHLQGGRFNDLLERPLSPMPGAGTGLSNASGEENVHSLDALARHGSSSRFSGMQAPQSDSREHVKQRSDFVKMKADESVILAPGQKRRIRVWYLPLCVPVQQDEDVSTNSELDRGRLLSDSFQLNFKLPSRESRTIEACSRVCESILRLERDDVHLGDCNVLTKYKSVLSIINCSDLSASATVSYVSQCVVADAHEIVIAPRETFDLGLDFIPRQVNPEYHKEITVTNVRNAHSPNLVFTLRANCIDRQGISLHALFYKILAPGPTNEIDFGVTVANHPTIRAFTVRNITKRKLVLKFNAGNGVKTYMPSRIGELLARDIENGDAEKQEEKGEKGLVNKWKQFSYLDELEERLECLRFLDGLVDFDVNRRSEFGTPVSRVNRQKERGCKFENESRRQMTAERESNGTIKETTQFEQEDEWMSLGGKEGWIEFLKSLEGGEFTQLGSMPMFFSNHDSELSYTERQFLPLRRLRAALGAGHLSEENILVLGPQAEGLVIVSLVLSDVEVRGKTKTRPFEKRLVVQMLAFDNKRLSDAAANSSKELNNIAKRFEGGQVSMPREILLSVQGCKSWMQIEPLRRLNFGVIACGEHKDKAFTIVNMSEAPLLYELKKTGSETSDDLRFNLGKGFQGVVRPYFSKVVSFIYAPTKEGVFEEKIIVENRLDKSASCEIVVRATVAHAGKG